MNPGGVVAVGQHLQHIATIAGTKTEHRDRSGEAIKSLTNVGLGLV